MKNSRHRKRFYIRNESYVKISFLLIFIGYCIITHNAKGEASLNNTSVGLLTESQFCLDCETILSKIQLIPVTSEAQQDQQIKELEYIYDTWHQYEDAYVTFFYPAHPEVTIDILDYGKNLPNEQFVSRQYRILFAERVLYEFKLDHVPAFAVVFDGGSSPVYEKYLINNDTIYQISFFKDGTPRLIQLLCKDLHLLMRFSQNYLHWERALRIALSISLKTPPYNRQEMLEHLQLYGFKGRLGLLEKGMSKEDISVLLGEPAESKPEGLLYVFEEESPDASIWKWTAYLFLKNGTLSGLDPIRLTHQMLPPKRGSIAWMLEKVFKHPLQRRDYELEPLNEKDIKYIFDVIAEQAPQVSGENWGLLCSIAFTLMQKGYYDSRILPLVQERFLEPTVDFEYALWILHEYDSEQSQELFMEKAVKLFAQIKENPEKAQAFFITHHNVFHLLSFITSPKLHELVVLLGMDHPHQIIREEAYRFWANLPEEQVLSKLEKGLADLEVKIRWQSATAFAKQYGTEENLPLLQQRLKKEPDDDVREQLEIAIQRLTIK